MNFDRFNSNLNEAVEEIEPKKLGRSIELHQMAAFLCVYVYLLFDFILFRPIRHKIPLMEILSELRQKIPMSRRVCSKFVCYIIYLTKTKLIHCMYAECQLYF